MSEILPVDVLLRMINSFSSSWDITEERASCLKLATALVWGESKIEVSNMLTEANNGAASWQSSAARIRALRAAVNGTKIPPSDYLEELAHEVSVGAECDGVQDRSWVKKTLITLNLLSGQTEKGRVI